MSDLQQRVEKLEEIVRVLRDELVEITERQILMLKMDNAMQNDVANLKMHNRVLG